MNAKAFFVDALSSALDLGIATPDDVLRHVTPDVLASHLPRPLWARLLTACVGAPRVDAQLVVETIGVSNLCEHVPSPVIWAVIAEVATRALGGEIPARPVAAIPSELPAAASKSEPTPLPITSPPPPEPPKPQPVRPTAVGPSIPSPLAAGSSSFDEPTRTLEEEPQQPARARTSTSQRFRPSNTGIGRLANNQRRPQAQAAAPEPVEPAPAPEPPRPTHVRRGQTEAEEIETEVASGNGDWRSALAVEDDQLVDWSASEETVTHAGDDPVFGRKR